MVYSGSGVGAERKTGTWTRTMRDKSQPMSWLVQCERLSHCFMQPICSWSPFQCRFQSVNRVGSSQCEYTINSLCTASSVSRSCTHAVEETLRHLGDDSAFVRFPVLLEATVQFTCNKTVIVTLRLTLRLYWRKSERDIASTDGFKKNSI